MTADEPSYPAWMAHDGVCTHPSGDPEHVALVRARFGGRDPIELVTIRRGTPVQPRQPW